MDHLRAVDALSSGWLAGILLLALGMLAYVNMVAPKQWTVLARSFGALRLGKHRLREELDLRDRTLTVLLVLSTMVIALFAYQVLLFHHMVNAGMSGFWRALLIVAMVITAQLLLLRLLAVLANADGGLQEYLYTVVVFHVVLGLVLLPVATVLSFPFRMAWRDVAWAVGVSFVILAVVFRWVRAGVIGRGNGVPARYIFIYICAFEILPALLALDYAWHFVPTSHTI